jgi:Rrf2 family protein
MRVTLGMRGDYAVRAMLALATVEGQDRPASVRWIAERMAIPVRFLPHVMTDLSRAGLVVGSPGRRGGYRLGRPATEISVLEVVDAVDTNDGEVPRCVLRGGPCRPDGRCAVHDVFAGATRALRESLSVQSLAEIAVPGAPGIELEPR